MRAPSWVIFVGIVALGALVLSPVVAALGIHPLPGDLTVNWGTHKVFLPLTQSVIASVGLGLLFLWARK
jgi:Protein of unknown function (DUF2905)